MRQPPRKRFSVGRRVLVGMGMRPGIVTFVDDRPSVLGEFRHDVQIDGQEPVSVLGCEVHALPELDEDLLRRNPPPVHLHVQNSNIGNLNFGSQLGTINAAVELISTKGDTALEFARALKQLTDAVVSQKAMSDHEKQEILQAVSTIAEQATKKPDERSKGVLKAVMLWLPTATTAVSEIAKLWETVGPVIKTHLGL